MKNQIISRNGSIQGIDEIPDDIKALYKTVWEVSQKTILKMAADRGAFIDQSQSLNVHVAEPNYGKLTSMHFYGWKLGLKTGKHKEFIEPKYFCGILTTYTNLVKLNIYKFKLQECTI